MTEIKVGDLVGREINGKAYEGKVKYFSPRRFNGEWVTLAVCDWARPGIGGGWQEGVDVRCVSLVPVDSEPRHQYQREAVRGDE